MVAADQPAPLDGIVLVLERAGANVVARATNGARALEEIRRHRPAVAVVDADLPAPTGVDAATEAARTVPETGVVIYTASADLDLLRRAVEAGVRAYVLKSRSVEKLGHAALTVAAGRTWVDPGLAGALMAAAVLPDRPLLTPREREVMVLVAEGLRSREVAARLGISTETVRLHLRRAMGKLDADTRTQAVATAIRRSVID